MPNTKNYRSQTFMLDLASQDIYAHNNDPKKIIKLVRDWLRNISKEKMSSGEYIVQKYEKFKEELPRLCYEAKTAKEELIFYEYNAMCNLLSSVILRLDRSIQI